MSEIFRKKKLFYFVAIGPNVDADVAEASLAASLRNAAAGQRISGQTEAKKLLDANPGVYVNCEQPLVQVKKKKKKIEMHLFLKICK